MSRVGRQMGTWAVGLSDEQRELIKRLLPPTPPTKQMERRLRDWRVYRSPTTINPPTTLLLRHYVLGRSKPVEYPITVDGVTLDEATSRQAAIDGGADAKG